MKDLFDAICTGLNIDNKEFGAMYAKMRYVPIIGRIHSDHTGEVIETLLNMELKSHEPITMIIASGGGSLQSAMDIGHIIGTLHSPVNALVVTKCGSAAFDLMLMCRERMALPNATFFIHYPRHNFEIVMDSKISDEELQILKNRAEQSVKWWQELYMRRLKRTEEQVHNLCHVGEKFNIHYDAETALSMGLIDRMVKDFRFFGK